MLGILCLYCCPQRPTFAPSIALRLDARRSVLKGTRSNTMTCSTVFICSILFCSEFICTAAGAAAGRRCLARLFWLCSPIEWPPFFSLSLHAFFPFLIVFFHSQHRVCRYSFSLFLQTLFKEPLHLSRSSAHALWFSSIAPFVYRLVTITNTGRKFSASSRTI
ncbi:hypothetical protein CPB86DRAFT_225026 [Serendipita vermifera]|nr:hypothetical protein CPB86DRAFT_225026 [Serendipita vermifera]